MPFLQGCNQNTSDTKRGNGWKWAKKRRKNGPLVFIVFIYYLLQHSCSISINLWLCMALHPCIRNSRETYLFLLCVMSSGLHRMQHDANAKWIGNEPLAATSCRAHRVSTVAPQHQGPGAATRWSFRKVPFPWRRRRGKPHAKPSVFAKRSNYTWTWRDSVWILLYIAIMRKFMLCTLW